jgi:hypothetical protein
MWNVTGPLHCTGASGREASTGCPPLPLPLEPALPPLPEDPVVLPPAATVLLVEPVVLPPAATVLLVEPVVLPPAPPAPLATVVPVVTDPLAPVLVVLPLAALDPPSFSGVKSFPPHPSHAAATTAISEETRHRNMKHLEES